MLTAKKWQFERDAGELSRIQFQIKQVQKAKGRHQQELLALIIEQSVQSCQWFKLTTSLNGK